MKVLIINGPNLNLLGKREPEIYGSQSFDEYIDSLNFDGIDIEVRQSNLEGEIINFIQNSDAKGIILNAGGYTHTSVAIHDAVKASDIPIIEVHISNIVDRETFRHKSLISPVTEGCIFGFGLEGYRLAIQYFVNQRGE
ncbi:MAG: type II 3-dehydroquinate dehydratase [Brumimicrobium sp.]